MDFPMVITWRIRLEDDEGEDEDKWSPYVSLKYPDDDLDLMEAPNDIVAPSKLVIQADYPLAGEFYFPIQSTDAQGFTRKEIVAGVANIYRQIYEDGKKFGIYGHSLGDLVFHKIERSAEVRDAVPVYTLEVDS